MTHLLMVATLWAFWDLCLFVFSLFHIPPTLTLLQHAEPQRPYDDVSCPYGSWTYGCLISLFKSPQKRKSHDQELVFTTIKTTNYSDNEEEDERDELEDDENHPSASVTSGGSSSYQVQASTRQAAGKTLDAEQPGEENEYEAGRVICDVCGEGVSIRDERTGAFSVTKFKEHRSSWWVVFPHLPYAANPVQRRHDQSTANPKCSELYDAPTNRNSACCSQET